MIPTWGDKAQWPRARSQTGVSPILPPSDSPDWAPGQRPGQARVVESIRRPCLAVEESERALPPECAGWRLTPRKARR